MTDTITATLYSFVPFNDSDDFEWVPVASTSGSKIDFGIVFVLTKKFNINASRLGIHMTHKHCAVEINSNVSIVKHDRNGNVIASSLTCYHNDCGDMICEIALLNIAREIRFNKYVQRPYPKSLYDEAVAALSKITCINLSHNERCRIIIGHAFKTPAVAENELMKCPNWCDVAPIEQKFPGANWSLEGVTPIHDPRFGVVSENGHPPYAITAVERECRHFDELFVEHQALLGKYAEISARYERSQKNLEKIAGMLSLEDDF